MYFRCDINRSIIYGISYKYVMISIQSNVGRQDLLCTYWWCVFFKCSRCCKHVMGTVYRYVANLVQQSFDLYSITVWGDCVTGTWVSVLVDSNKHEAELSPSRALRSIRIDFDKCRRYKPFSRSIRYQVLHRCWLNFYDENTMDISHIYILSNMCRSVTLYLHRVMEAVQANAPIPQGD